MATQTVWGPLKALMECFNENGFGRVEMQRLVENADVLVRIGKGEWSRGILNQSISQQLAPFAHFRPEVLERVRALGGQFSGARLTAIPGGETLVSQRDTEVIKFQTAWPFLPEEAVRLSVAPSIGSEVVYLESLVEGSMRCTYNKVVKGQLSVQEVLDGLPQVEGLRWIVGNTPTVNRILANHLTETGKYLLPSAYTWTSDSYQSSLSGLCRLLVGYYNNHGVGVSTLWIESWLNGIGLFVLGVPAA